jgi:sulfatase modifying factor 1
MRIAPLLLVVALCVPASTQAVTIQTVPVGNAGNADDVNFSVTAGSVDYDFEIGKYEVTNAQYAEFLNAADPTGGNLRGLYNPSMTSDARGGINFTAAAANGTKYSVKALRANNPVAFVGFFDAARFSNWLHNGQGAADTEDGAYKLTGGTPIPANASSVARKVTATWCLPSFDEWYKAAYHKNDGATGNYFDYPTASDTEPTSDQPPGTTSPNPANTANFLLNDGLANGFNDGYAVTGSPAINNTLNYLTDVGAYNLADSAYGTFDQGGNVWEWTDTNALETRRVGGGAWINAPSFLAAANATNGAVTDTESNTIGFRVARVVPGLLPGDYNGNAALDAADYTIWRDTLGSTTDLRANGDNTGASQNIIDQADYDFWIDEFTESGGGVIVESGPVPEPSTLLLLLASMGCSSLGQRRRLRIS